MTVRQFETIPDDGRAARDERRYRILEVAQLFLSGTYTRREALLRVGFFAGEAGHKSTQTMLSWWKRAVEKTAHENADQQVDE